MTVHEIHEAFSGVRYPGDSVLAEHWPNEWEATLSRLRGKEWESVTAADFDSQGGIIEGVQCLTAAGFVYYLPGLMRLALTELPHRYAVASALLSGFAVPDYRRLPSKNLQSNVIALLSERQRDVTRQFFLDVQGLEPTLCPPVLESAARNLKEGRITPYAQNDVLEWARQQSARS